MPQEGKRFHRIVSGAWYWLSLMTVAVLICEFETDMTVIVLFSRLCLISNVRSLFGSSRYLLLKRLYWKTFNKLWWQVYTYFILSNTLNHSFC